MEPSHFIASTQLEMRAHRWNRNVCKADIYHFCRKVWNVKCTMKHKWGCVLPSARCHVMQKPWRLPCEMHALFLTCAVAVWTRRTRQAVTLATCSWGGSMRVQRTWSRPCPATELTARNTITVMTSRTQMENRISWKNKIQQIRRRMLN